MSLFSALNIGSAKGKKDIQLRVGKHPLITIHANGLREILSAFPAVMEYLVSLSSNPESASIIKSLDRVEQFMDTYFRMRSEYFGKKSAITSYKKGSPQYNHFVKALQIIDTHEVTFEYFIKSQIEGMKFLIDLGKKTEAFPQPGHLSTPEAETRLIKYMSSVNTKSRPLVTLTKSELETPLKQNNKFVALFEKFFTNGEEITIEEAIYLEQCFIARKKAVPSKLESFIENNL